MTHPRTIAIQREAADGAQAEKERLERGRVTRRENAEAKQAAARAKVVVARRARGESSDSSSEEEEEAGGEE
jgi:hypothetical protein